MWVLCWFACAGKSAVDDSQGDVYQWEEGAVAPKIFSGSVYCQWTDAGLQTFLELQVDDPQGPFDIREGRWTAVSPNGQELAEDVLYCDEERTCYYSYTPDQYPLLPCDDLEDYTLEAVLEDYSGNLSEPYVLRYLGIQ